MKKFLILALGVLMFTSCAKNKVIHGQYYETYGLLNENTVKNDSIEYQVSGWAFASGVIFCETIVVPIYVFGFHLWEPIGWKSDYHQVTTINHSDYSLASYQQPKPMTKAQYIARKKFEYYTHKAAYYEMVRDKQVKNYTFKPNSSKLPDSIKIFQDSASYWYKKSQ